MAKANRVRSTPRRTASKKPPTIEPELIELGARFEPLLDQYYVAERRWSISSARAYDATSAAMSAIHDEMKPLAKRSKMR
jgi:hypothetical protein